MTNETLYLVKGLKFACRKGVRVAAVSYCESSSPLRSS